MEDIVTHSAVLPPKKSSTTLSVDRAAFLLLRVKKAFKRKRQQRKDKQQQHSTNAAQLNVQGNRLSRKVTTPLLRSHTLPAIVVPGLPVVSLHTEKTQVFLDENLSILNNKSTCRPDNRWGLLRRNTTAQSTTTIPIYYKPYNFNNNNNTITNKNNNHNDGKYARSTNNHTTLSMKSLNLPKEDVTLAFRRKSSGSTPNSNDLSKLPVNYYANSNNDVVQYYDGSIHTLIRTPSITDDLPCYAADGSVLLRIPAPDIVAARAYRLASKSSATSTGNNLNNRNNFDNSTRLNVDYPVSSSDDGDSGILDIDSNNQFRTRGNYPYKTDDDILPEYTGTSTTTSTSISSISTTVTTTPCNTNSNLSNVNFTRRFAKLLHHSTSSGGIKSSQQQQQQNPIQTQSMAAVATAAGGAIKYDNSHNSLAFLTTSIYNKCNNEAPRRLSWERRKDSSALQRSASIDSYAEIVWSDMPQSSTVEIITKTTTTATTTMVGTTTTNAAQFSKRPSTSSLYSTTSSIAGALHISSSNGTINNNNSQINAATASINNSNSRHENLLSPSAARRSKLTRVVNALFAAVENGHLDKARTILESTDVNVNSINTDGLSALDIAVLSNNRSMTKMLLQHGALESSQYSVDNLGTKLNGLLQDAECRIQDLNGSEGTCQPNYTTRSSISSIIIGNTNSSVTGCTGNEIDKQIGVWERRIKGLRRLILGWDQARPPDAPASVIVDVIGETSIQVQILEPFDGAIGTKFKVQWSTRADFSNVVGERELMDWRSFHGTMGTQCKINNLTQGRRYFIRASCGNVKGWGGYKNSVPTSVIPSSWRDLNNREDRFMGRQQILDNLFAAVRLARPADVSELTLESHMCNQQKKNPKKKTTIKQLFSVASKFQKHLKRGIHLASIIYCEDKVLVTSEEFLPVIEIDESYPASSLYNDYHWLMKVACSWDDVKSLRSDMERNLTSANQFRIKLLTAVCQMQSALGLNDLGQLYYKPLKDAQCGTVVITAIHNVRNQKSVSILNSRWLPINKLQKKVIALHEEYNISEMLVSSLSDQIKYNQVALQPLSSGLYLGYLKMQCSMDQIQVFVPLKTPNVLPHYKIRDNHHINAEEWLILKRYNNNSEGATIMNICQRSPLGMSLDPDCASSTKEGDYAEATTEVQRLFLYDLSQALQKLLHFMNVRPEESNSHRLYDLEVIEHSKDISFLIICPAVQLSCNVPGQAELLSQRHDLAPLSVQSFEMIHLRTYHPAIMEKYARLSCILELDTTLANQSHREAFANSELKIAKERLAKLQELTNSLNTVWKSVRWLMDVIAFARDKNSPSTSTIKEILQFAQNCTENTERNSQLLQPPLRDVQFHKAGTGRGSWPGPSSTGTDETINNSFKAEYSKSEQNLGVGQQNIITMPVMCKQDAQDICPQNTIGMASSYLHISKDFIGSENFMRKRSADSVCSQYMTTGIYSSAIDAVRKTVNAGSATTTTSNMSFYNIPSSRSDDTLAESKRPQKSLMQQKCTSSNIITTCSTPTMSGNVSRSVPLLGMESNLKPDSTNSLKFELDINYAKTKELSSTNAQNSKIKSVSIANLQEGGGFPLKTTLTSLQTDIKTAIPITIGDSRAITSTITRGLERQSSNIELSTISYPSLSLGDQTSSTSPTSGIIQVYTAYNTGLASGTSLKLHVTAKTTAREIINLVVKQLNMATALKGNNGPIYSTDMLNNFCLVAVIGARERCLRDDFKPLLLQNPWRKGRLYVRQKHELLAAIEHSSRKPQLI